MKIVLTMVSLACVIGIEAFSKQHIHELTLEEKVGQVLMVHFIGEKINDDAKALVQDLKVGGVIYYNWANKLNSPVQVAELSSGLQQLAADTSSHIPLFIAVDQEGGVVSRMTQGFTVFPGNKALGEINSTELIKDAMNVMGQELSVCGVNFNFAPVVDVNVNPLNPVIGVRSFGDNPKTVTLCAKAAIQGLKSAGIISTIKHFPGHGDVTIDSHYELPCINKTLKELEKCELYPFKKLSQDCDVIMTAHLKVDALDRENCTTFSKKTISYLREKLKFKGLVISDSIVMNGALKQVKNVEEAAVKAFNAGCDIILIGGKSLVGSTTPELKIEEIKNIHKALVNAVTQGVISKQKLDQSVSRILALKSKYKITQDSTPKSVTEFIRRPEAVICAKSIASKALNVKMSKDVSLKDKKIAIFAPSVLFAELSKTQFQHLSNHVSEFYYEGFEPNNEDLEKSLIVADQADVLIFLTYNAWKNKQQISLINRLHILNKPAILIVTRDPMDAELFEDVHVIYKTFSPTHVSLESVCDHLVGTCL
jgi:beta-N-acetylhexosaminidase